MVAVAHTAGQPHTVVVKSIATTITQLAMLSVVRDHNLKQKMQSIKQKSLCTCTNR